MELQWNHTSWDYLKCLTRQVQNQEQTLEVRISDGMPDIGRVICAWGQPILRSKEWRSDGIGIAGGVSVWVLYAPEDGSEPQSVQAWLPFTGKWPVSDSRREGIIQADVMLRGVDARTLSARKLMVRANLGLLGCALEPEQADIYEPGELPEQVYVWKKTYPVNMDVEAGEKLLSLEESFSLPISAVKLLSCRIRPQLTEQTVAGSRIILRGTAYADAIYLDDMGNIQQQTLELPFAQFADLDREYDKEATAAVSAAVSNLEPELTENGLHIKCGLVAQYMIRQQRLLHLAEDAYSPHRIVTPNIQQLRLPAVLECRREYRQITQKMDAMPCDPVSAFCLPDHPTVYRETDRTSVELPGCMGLIYRDGDGALQYLQEPWADNFCVPAADDGKTEVNIGCIQPVEVRLTGDGVEITGQIQLDMRTMTQLEVPMVCGMEIGEVIQPDPSRPSVLLQRMGQQDLWNIAKDTGSTVEAIWQANGLQEEPVPGQMLLIPIL